MTSSVVADARRPRGRTIRRLLSAFTLGLLAVIVLAMPALAGRSWCAKDPIVRLNGADVQIWVAIPEEFVPTVTGPVQVKVYTPVGVSQELIFVDQGFNGFGENVKFSTDEKLTVRADGSFDVIIKAWVPVDRELAKALGATRGGHTIPFQITVVTNGDLVTHDNGMMEVINGETFMVEQTNDMTKIAFVVAPSQ